MIPGKLWKDGKDWIIEVPLLEIVTQGKSRSDAFDMMSDAITELANTRGFTVTFSESTNGEFYVIPSDPGTLISLLLKRQRIINNKTLEDMADLLGYASHNTYYQYEKGIHIPSVEKLEEFLSAMNSDFNITTTLVVIPKSHKEHAIK